MDEEKPPGRDKFGVRLNWPHTSLEPSEFPASSHPEPLDAMSDLQVAPGESADLGVPAASLAPMAARLDSLLNVSTSFQRVVSEHLTHNSSQVARMGGIVARLQSGVDEVSAALHRLVASTLEISTELGAIAAVARQTATQTSSLITSTAAANRRLEEGLRGLTEEVRADQAGVAALRDEVAQVAEEVTAVRRRLTVRGRESDVDAEHGRVRRPPQRKPRNEDDIAAGR